MRRAPRWRVHRMMASHAFHLICCHEQVLLNAYCRLPLVQLSSFNKTQLHSPISQTKTAKNLTPVDATQYLGKSWPTSPLRSIQCRRSLAQYS